MGNSLFIFQKEKTYEIDLNHLQLFKTKNKKQVTLKIESNRTQNAFLSVIITLKYYRFFKNEVIDANELSELIKKKKKVRPNSHCQLFKEQEEMLPATILHLVR